MHWVSNFLWSKMLHICQKSNKKLFQTTVCVTWWNIMCDVEFIVFLLFNRDEDWWSNTTNFRQGKKNQSFLGQSTTTNKWVVLHFKIPGVFMKVQLVLITLHKKFLNMGPILHDKIPNYGSNFQLEKPQEIFNFGFCQKIAKMGTFFQKNP